MNKLSEWMHKKDVKQRRAAKKIGVCTSTLQEILRKGRMPSIKVAYEIEKYTGGDVTLYDWIDPNMLDDTIKKNIKSVNPKNKST